MQQFTLVLFLTIICFFTSCKEDEVPPAIISFTLANSSVGEGDGTAKLSISLDKAAPGDIVVNYTITGSAQVGSDYESTGSFTILNGATEGELSIKIVEDDVFEFDPKLTSTLGEVMEITLSGVSGNGKLSEVETDLKHLLVIKDNDPVAESLTIQLSWDSGNGTPGDVDMDLILFLIDPDDGPIVLAASNRIGTAFEGIIIGTPAPDGIYALACRYFEGTSNKLTFTVKYTAKEGTLQDGLTTKSYSGVYTLANVNGDVSENATVQIVQTFEKKGPDYIQISEIKIPEKGSREKGNLLTAPTKGKAVGLVSN